MAAADKPQLLNFNLITNAQLPARRAGHHDLRLGHPGLLHGDLDPAAGRLSASRPIEFGPHQHAVLGRRAADLAGRRPLRLALSADPRRASASALLVGGILWLHFIIAGLGDSIDHWTFLPPLLLAGLGLGLGFSALFQTVLAGIPPRDAGSGLGRAAGLPAGRRLGRRGAGRARSSSPSLGDIASLFQHGPAAVHAGLRRRGGDRHLVPDRQLRRGRRAGLAAQGPRPQQHRAGRRSRRTAGPVEA